jgi:outer membrane protein assembly factor BamB
MFHVKHRKPLIAVLAATVLLAVGCANIASPEGWAAPAVDGNTIFVQLERGTISAGTLSTSGTFSESWRYPSETDDLNFDGFYATPVVSGDAVYVASHDGSVVALSTKTGRPVWPAVVELDSTVVATPLVDRQSMYVPTEDGELVVLDAENGNEIRRLLDPGGRIWSAPVAKGSTFYVGTFDGREVSAVNVSTGISHWTSDAGGAVSADLVLTPDLVLAGSLGRSIRAFDTNAGGDPAWTYPTQGWVVSTPLVAGSTVYGATLQGEVFSLDADNGNENWLLAHEGLEFRSKPALMDGVLVLADRDGRLRGLDPATGELRWQSDIEDAKLFADPVAYQGSLIYVSKDGDLFQVSPRDGSTSVAFSRGG